MLEVLEVVRDPASVDEDGVGLVVAIEMGVERRDDLYAFFSLVNRFDPYLSCVIVVAL